MRRRVVRRIFTPLGLALAGFGLYITISEFDLTAPIPSMFGLLIVVLGSGVVLASRRLGNE